MGLLRRIRGKSKTPIPPCPSRASISRDTENINGIAKATVTTLFPACQGSSSPDHSDSVLTRCAACQERNVAFPGASPFEDSIAPPNICITCIENSRSIATVGECSTDAIPTDGSQAGARRTIPSYLPCVTCQRPLPASEFPVGYIVESCRHEPDICLDCIEKFIVEGLDHGLAQCISCPQCGEPMSKTDVWRLSGSSTFQR